RGRRAGALRAEGRRRARRRAAPGAHRSSVSPRAALPADAVDRRGRLLRRPRRDRRVTDVRTVLSLLPAAPAARLAARGTRLDPLARAACDRLRLTELRLAPGNRVDPRADAPPVAARRAGRRAVRGRALFLRERLGGALGRGAR